MSLASMLDDVVVRIAQEFNAVRAEMAAGGGSAPANMVTTDTTQTITGAKTFSGSLSTTDLYVTQNDDSYPGMNFETWSTARANLLLNAPDASPSQLSTSSRIQLTAKYWNGIESAFDTAGTIEYESPGGDSRFTFGGPIYAPSLFDNGNRVYSAGNPPASMMTIDTEQTITGWKSFSGPDAGLAFFGDADGSGIERGFEVWEGGMTFSSTATAETPTPAARIDFNPGLWGSGGPTTMSISARHNDANSREFIFSAPASFANVGNVGASARMVGRQASGPPTVGAHRLGDFSVSATGRLYICTADGTPGTWADAGALPNNAVTTDTQQTLAGRKLFTAGLAVQNNNEALAGNPLERPPNFTFGGSYWDGSQTEWMDLKQDVYYLAGGHTQVSFWSVGGSNLTEVNSLGWFKAGSLWAAESGNPAARDSVSGFFEPEGMLGAGLVSRWVGATASSAPSSGTFQAGDYVIARNGRVWICTAAGTPGTWVDAGVPTAHTHVKADITNFAHTHTAAEVNAIEPYVMAVTGTLAIQTGKSRIYLEGNYVIETVRASVNTAPTGASIIVDVNKNGTTIYTTQTARPTIAASSFTATGNSPAVTTFAAGDYITVDVDQVGSTVAGSDLTVTIRLRRV